ncbi:MAG: translational GTPase TypA [Myxococcales bacterium]|nr:translational GTPase TypA [Myxococcales bacterium]
MQLENIRNIAIIAHVDHGKTTLIDGILKQTHSVAEHRELADRAMDSNDLERERGITIVSKCTAIHYRGHRINIVDTPGHADFGGEVERVLRMVDSVLLLVDAFEGPMPQTKFVLRKALALGLRPIVVLNKIDRPDSRPDTVLNLVFDLFVQLNASDEQLDFPVMYASARDGYASGVLDAVRPPKPGTNLTPLLDLVLSHVDPPHGRLEAPLRMQVATLDYSDYLGRLAIGRIYDGEIALNQRVLLCRREGLTTEAKVTKLLGFKGLERVEVQKATAGDIVIVAGLSGVLPGETVCHIESPNPLPMIAVDEPTISMRFSINNGPFSGQDGKFLTSRKIRERLEKELEHNVSLRVEAAETADAFIVSGRGELHLAILIETMRREGYELCVGRPKVILRESDGQMLEPIEELVIDVPAEHSGGVIEKLNERKGEMQEMQNNDDGTVRMRYMIPSRGLIGFRNKFLTDTRGTGVMYHNFDHYGRYRGETPGRQNGAMVVQEPGDTTSYALYNLQERGTLFHGPAVPVYAGQIVGLQNRDNDLIVNPCKKKHLTNIRSAGADDALRLTPPKVLSLETALELIEDDELVEVTPKKIRVRKTILDHQERLRQQKQSSSSQSAA